jgi:hypothetical protein
MVWVKETCMWQCFSLKNHELVDVLSELRGRVRRIK